METAMGMGMVFVPRVGVHLHPFHQPCAYCHHQFMLIHQQQQQEQEQENKMVYKERMPKKFRWTFPGSTMLKLNTDGSSKGNPGPSSFGGLIRDSEGRWLCGYIGKMKGRSFTSLEAELWSILQGLCLVKKKNMSNLMIETDSQAALLLTTGGVDKDDPMKTIMDAIIKILIAQKCVLVHTRRDGNHSADQLAKFGGNQFEEFKLLKEPPAQLIPYLLRDNEAAAEFEWSNSQSNY